MTHFDWFLTCIVQGHMAHAQARVSRVRALVKVECLRNETTMLSPSDTGSTLKARCLSPRLSTWPAINVILVTRSPFFFFFYSLESVFLPWESVSSFDWHGNGSRVPTVFITATILKWGLKKIISTTFTHKHRKSSTIQFANYDLFYYWSLHRIISVIFVK